MSKNLESYDLQIAMREDLMQCYREVAPNCLTQQGAWRKTALHPAKRYYVSPKQAMQQISLYLQGRTEIIDNMKPLRRKMWLSLMDEVLKLSQEPEHVGKSLIKICRIAVMKPAPQFFMDAENVRHIFARVKKKKYDEYGRLKTPSIPL